MDGPGPKGELVGKARERGHRSAEDELDFEFLASYNNSAYMALHNAAQDKAAADPLADVPDVPAFVSQRLQALAAQAPQLAHPVASLRQTYQL